MGIFGKILLGVNLLAVVLGTAATLDVYREALPGRDVAR